MHSGHAEKDEVQTHQSAQQAKSMLMMQRRVNEMRQQYMGKQQVKATSDSAIPTGIPSQDFIPSLCFQAKYARLSKHQLTCHDMTTA